MMHEYIITAFKVIVGVITENKITLIALIALGILLVWMFLSLVFSFQGKFAGNVKRINEYVSRNGIYGNAKSGFELLVSKMPTEFQRGYKKFERTPNTLPSDHITRFESLDMELSGGVFNQNKSVLKTFIHFIFVGLLVLSLAILPVDESLTGYSLSESAIIPLLFFIVAKIMYYTYTAIRQFQYKSAIEEFNQMLENLDRFVADFKNEEKVPSIVEEINSLTDEEYETFSGKKEDINKFVETKEILPIENIEVVSEKKIPELDVLAEADSENVSDLNDELTYIEEDEGDIEQLKEDVVQIQESDDEQVTLDYQNQVEEEVNMQSQEEIEEKEYIDNFKPDFSEILEEDEMENVVKRGRGRPRKEITNVGEFVINNDKEFEDALVRAEKLMRKNEEPLSASQTKRIEKQIKELVDAMTKYKEGK